MPERFQAFYDETAPAIVPPPEPNALAPPPTWADAAAQNTQAVQDFIAWQRGLTGDDVQRALDPAPNTRYGSVLPIAQDTETGERRLALPSSIRSLAQGVYDLTQGPKTGTVTPEATMALLAAVNPLARPQAGVLSAFGKGPAPVVRGIEDRVSTRVPTAKGSPDAHASPDFIIDRASARQGDAYEKNAELLKDPTKYPDLPAEVVGNTEQAVDTASTHMGDNLRHIYDGMVQRWGPELVERAKHWYDGANDIAHRWADEFGHEPRQVAGMLANLSPQKDWFQNVDLGRRLLAITQRQGNSPFTPEMEGWFKQYLEGKAGEKGVTEAQLKSIDAMGQDVERLRGVPFSQMQDPYDRALFARAYDEVNHGKSYPVVTPEGQLGDPVLTDGGAPRKIGWGSFNEIGKALEALGSQSLPEISRTLGLNHKVRNFYNNIISPNAPFGDVTIDTHAIAAAHLRPLGGKDPVVKRGLGMTGSANASTGSQGLYPVYADAYRNTARGLDLLPRELQSITWEGGRGLFSDVMKRDPSFLRQNVAYWDAFRRGEIDAAQARRLITEHAQGIDAPPWWRGVARQ